jgi:hypothetical protein
MIISAFQSHGVWLWLMLTQYDINKVDECQIEKKKDEKAAMETRGSPFKSRVP